MTNRIRNARANAADQGFTLIEMLIVIIVLGVLAGITVFGVATFREDAQASACDASVKTVETASDAYNAKNDDYVGVADLVTAGYLKQAPSADYSIAVSDAGVVTGSCA